MNKAFHAAIIFLVLFSSIVINAQVNSANSIVVPEIQTSMEKSKHVQESIGVTSRVYVKITNAQS